MQVAAMSVQMTDADPGAKRNIGRDILHRFGVQTRLKLRRHKTISVTRVYQTEEVDGEHSAVESNGDNNQAEKSGREVLEPDTL